MLLADGLLYLSAFILYKWAETFFISFYSFIKQRIEYCNFLIFNFLHVTIYHGVHSPSVNRLLPHSFIECGTYVVYMYYRWITHSPMYGICLFSTILQL